MTDFGRPVLGKKKTVTACEVANRLFGIPNFPSLEQLAQEEQVCEGAIVKCQYGEEMRELSSSTMGPKVTAGNQNGLTIKDTTVKGNDFGNCTYLKLKSGKDKDIKCKGKFDEEWEGSDGNTRLGGQPALTKGCKLGCKAIDRKEVISILASGQGTSSQEILDKAAIKTLKSCKIYGEVFYGLDGQPRINWHIMKNGKGVDNPKLYRYLNRAGEYLNPDMIEFVSQEVWNEMMKDGFRRGVIISSEKEYNWLVRGALSSAQYVQDGVEWTNDSGMADVLQMLCLWYLQNDN